MSLHGSDRPYDLFRQQALDKRRRRLAGEVVVTQPKHLCVLVIALIFFATVGVILAMSVTLPREVAIAVQAAEWRSDPGVVRLANIDLETPVEANKATVKPRLVVRTPSPCHLSLVRMEPLPGVSSGQGIIRRRLIVEVTAPRPNVRCALPTAAIQLESTTFASLVWQRFRRTT